ncbi:MAG: PD40 domain-containing protein [Prevotella sp.]|nr:PD40 domain-containing protein [Prevotella sp.]
MRIIREFGCWGLAIGCWLLAVGCLLGCRQTPTEVTKVDRQPAIYPDYIDVTIPVDIAPLNFSVVGEDIDKVDVQITGSKGGALHTHGDYADFDITDWQALTEQNRGGDLRVTVCARKDGKWLQYQDFNIHVSTYPLTDWGVTYRRIAPGYEVGGDIGMYQRDIHTFDEYAMLRESAVPGRCMNCHTANRTDPSQLTLQIRGEGGGTLIQIDGKQYWFETKTDSTKAAGSYAYWHPSGNYCAYATNAVHQSFFVGKGQRIEGYHNFSNVVLLDVRSHELILAPELMTETDLEIFPAFSADGKHLYYSTSKSCQVPAEYMKVKCSICRIGFDAENGRFEQEVDTLLNGLHDNRSYTLARPSYDGRWLMYCVTSRSNFPVFQPDADLWLMDLKTGQTRPVREANSNDVESYHNWSSDSHWFVFSSKREDGMYAQLYFASIDEQGRVTKPFLLPQRNPKKFYREMFDSYNVPDFTKRKVDFDAREASRQVFRHERIPVRIRQ